MFELSTTIKDLLKTFAYTFIILKIEINKAATLPVAVFLLKTYRLKNSEKKLIDTLVF